MLYTTLIFNSDRNFLWGVFSWIFFLNNRSLKLFWRTHRQYTTAYIQKIQWLTNFPHEIQLNLTPSLYHSLKFNVPTLTSVSTPNPHALVAFCLYHYPPLNCLFLFSILYRQINFVYITNYIFVIEWILIICNLPERKMQLFWKG